MKVDRDLERIMEERAVKLAEELRKPAHIRSWESLCRPPCAPLLLPGEMPRTVRVAAGDETLIPAGALAGSP